MACSVCAPVCDRELRKRVHSRHAAAAAALHYTLPLCPKEKIKLESTTVVRSATYIFILRRANCVFSLSCQCGWEPHTKIDARCATAFVSHAPMIVCQTHLCNHKRKIQRPPAIVIATVGGPEQWEWVEPAAAHMSHAQRASLCPPATNIHDCKQHTHLLCIAPFNIFGRVRVLLVWETAKRIATRARRILQVLNCQSETKRHAAAKLHTQSIDTNVDDTNIPFTQTCPSACSHNTSVRLCIVATAGSIGGAITLLWNAYWTWSRASARSLRLCAMCVCVRRNACSVREMLSAHKKMPNYDSLSQRHAHRPTDRPAIHPIHVYMRHHIHTHGRLLACVWARLSFACRGSARLESNLDIELSFSNVLVVVESTYRT